LLTLSSTTKRWKANSSVCQSVPSCPKTLTRSKSSSSTTVNKLHKTDSSARIGSVFVFSAEQCILASYTIHTFYKSRTVILRPESFFSVRPIFERAFKSLNLCYNVAVKKEDISWLAITIQAPTKSNRRTRQKRQNAQNGAGSG